MSEYLIDENKNLVLYSEPSHKNYQMIVIDLSAEASTESEVNIDASSLNINSEILMIYAKRRYKSTSSTGYKNVYLNINFSSLLYIDKFVNCSSQPLDFSQSPGDKSWCEFKLGNILQSDFSPRWMPVNSSIRLSDDPVLGMNDEILVGGMCIVEIYLSSVI